MLMLIENYFISCIFMLSLTTSLLCFLKFYSFFHLFLPPSPSKNTYKFPLLFPPFLIIWFFKFFLLLIRRSFHFYDFNFVYTPIGCFFPLLFLRIPSSKNLKISTAIQHITYTRYSFQKRKTINNKLKEELNLSFVRSW